MVGYDREDLASGRIRRADLTPPEWRDRTAQAQAELMMTGTFQPYEKEYFRKDGSRVPVLIGAASFDETHTQGVVFVLDLTEHKRADQALRESEEQWKAVFENNPTMYFMVDPTGTIMSVNPFGAEHLGYTADELIGRPVQNLFHEADREIVRRHMASCLEQLGHASSWELRKIRKDGEVLWVRETARAMLIKQQPVVLIVCEDITERKLAEEALGKVQMELAHANRVATMGQLTSSIAHEVSQPIAATIISAQAALHWLDAEPPALEEVRQALDRIVKNGSRAGEVIDKIRALIKKAPPRKDRLDINEAIREVIELTRGEAVKNNVSVQTDLADGLPLIEGDRVQLQQVILNLIINAVQAMSGVSEGPRELLISTGRAEPNGVLVAVQDSGPGIAPEVLDRLFEPFYTTKARRVGAGAVDLPVDHRSAWRPIVGKRKRARRQQMSPRRHLSLHRARRPGQRIVMAELRLARSGQQGAARGRAAADKKSQARGDASASPRFPSAPLTQSCHIRLGAQVAIAFFRWHQRQNHQMAAAVMIVSSLSPKCSRTSALHSTNNATAPTAILAAAGRSNPTRLAPGNAARPAPPLPSAPRRGHREASGRPPLPGSAGRGNPQSASPD